MSSKLYKDRHSLNLMSAKKNDVNDLTNRLGNMRVGRDDEDYDDDYYEATNGDPDGHGCVCINCTMGKKRMETLSGLPGGRRGHRAHTAHRQRGRTGQGYADWRGGNNRQHTRDLMGYNEDDKFAAFRSKKKGALKLEQTHGHNDRHGDGCTCLDCLMETDDGPGAWAAAARRRAQAFAQGVRQTIGHRKQEVNPGYQVDDLGKQKLYLPKLGQVFGKHQAQSQGNWWDTGKELPPGVDPGYSGQDGRGDEEVAREWREGVVKPARLDRQSNSRNLRQSSKGKFANRFKGETPAGFGHPESDEEVDEARSAKEWMVAYRKKGSNKKETLSGGNDGDNDDEHTGHETDKWVHDVKPKKKTSSHDDDASSSSSSSSSDDE